MGFRYQSFALHLWVQELPDSRKQTDRRLVRLGRSLESLGRGPVSETGEIWLHERQRVESLGLSVVSLVRPNRGVLKWELSRLGAHRLSDSLTPRCGCSKKAGPD